MENIQKQIKHLIVITSENVRNQLQRATATQNEIDNLNSYLLARIDEIYKWICGLEHQMLNDDDVVTQYSQFPLSPGN